MKLVRIDDLAPGRGRIELHPQLTLLRGATVEARRGLHRLFRSLSGAQDPGVDGLIEVSGVQLALDRPTLDDLRLDPHVDAILTWSGTASDVTVAAGGGGQTGPPVQTRWQAPLTEPGVPAVSTASAMVVEANARDLDEDRQQLRAVTIRRTELGARMDAARAGLDSFASAALEVCIGQIDALESRRSSLRARWEQDHAARRAERDRLLGEARRRAELIDLVAAIDPTGVRSAMDDLRVLLLAPVEPDPVAAELAVQVDEAMRRRRDLQGRTASFELRRHEAEQRLADAALDAREAEQSMRSRAFDRSEVGRLEQVRDEIFAVDDRHGLLGAHRNKRKVQELRAEEAVLLERLGFDTYSSYVMGIPSVRTELERSARLDTAMTRVEQVEREIQSLVADAPDPRELSNAENDLQRLIVGASRLLGLAEGTRDVEDISGVVHQIVTGLRELRIANSVEWDDDSIAAAVQVRRAVTDIAGGRFADPQGTAPPSVAGTQIGVGDWNGSPQDLLIGVDGWLEALNDASVWAASERAAVAALHQQVQDLDREDLHRDEVSEWAVVESELDAALDRMAAAEDRVRGHDHAMAQLAELREVELSLRAQERDLLAVVARGEKDRRSTATRSTSDPVPDAGSDIGGALRTSAPLPPIYRAADSTPQIDRAETVGRSASAALDAEWSVIERLARQRSVSFVGSIPILLDGLPSDRATRAAVMDRVVRMGDLVQVVVVSDDQQVIDWVAELGDTAAVVAL